MHFHPEIMRVGTRLTPIVPSFRTQRSEMPRAESRVVVDEFDLDAVDPEERQAALALKHLSDTETATARGHWDGANVITGDFRDTDLEDTDLVAADFSEPDAIDHTLADRDIASPDPVRDGYSSYAEGPNPALALQLFQGGGRVTYAPLLPAKPKEPDDLDLARYKSLLMQSA